MGECMYINGNGNYVQRCMETVLPDYRDAQVFGRFRPDAN